LPADSGFEDREGHQAPFTLREKENALPTAGSCTGEQCKEIRSLAPLLFDGLDCLDDSVEVRPIAGFEFGMDEFSISADFKGAAAGRNESKRFDALAEFENFGRQTDGLGRVVSNHTIFDRNVGLHFRPPLQERRV
jgi:hypothetical protein